MTGTSVIGAAADVERKIKDQAAEILECATEDLELAPGGMVAVKGIPHRNVSFAAVSGRAHWAAGGPIIGSHSWVFDQKTVDPKRASVTGLPFPQIGGFVFNATVVEVDVDDATGKCRVESAWSACDVGRAINPQMVEGQIEGGFVQGLGYALFEEMVWNGAQIANPSLMDYKIPTFVEAPSQLHAIIVEIERSERPLWRQKRRRNRHQQRRCRHCQRGQCGNRRAAAASAADAAARPRGDRASGAEAVNLAGAGRGRTPARS